MYVYLLLLHLLMGYSKSQNFEGMGPSVVWYHLIGLIAKYLPKLATCLCGRVVSKIDCQSHKCFQSVCLFTVGSPIPRCIGPHPMIHCDSLPPYTCRPVHFRTPPPHPYLLSWGLDLASPSHRSHTFGPIQSWDWQTSGRLASYWKTFLLLFCNRALDVHLCA